MSDSDEEVERWKNRLHEVTTLNCNMMIRSLHQVTTEVRMLPENDDTTNGEEFVDRWGTMVQKQERVLHATTIQRWKAPRKIRWNEREWKRQLHVWVGDP